MWYKHALKKVAEGIGGGAIQGGGNFPVPSQHKEEVTTEVSFVGEPPSANEVLQEIRTNPNKDNPEEMSLSQQIEELNHQKNNTIDDQSMASLEGAKGFELVRGMPQYNAYQMTQN